MKSARSSYLRIETEHQHPLVNNKEKYMWAGRTDWRGLLAFVDELVNYDMLGYCTTTHGH